MRVGWAEFPRGSLTGSEKGSLKPLPTEGEKPRKGPEWAHSCVLQESKKASVTSV